MLPLSELWSAYAPTVVGAGVVCYLVWSVRSWYRLRKFDGPWLARHSYLWLLRAVTNNKMHVNFPELHRKYGE